MDDHIRKVYVPMTETGFYILLCLRKETHGYGIVQQTERLTNGEIRLSPGTLYGSLSKMEKDGLIEFVRKEEKRKIYRITALGTQVLDLEMKRIERLYNSMKEKKGWEYLQNYVGYSYFRKPASDAEENEEIFCDDASRLDMMKRVFRRRIIPLIGVLFLIILPELYLQSRFDTVYHHILFIVFCLFLILYLVLLAIFFYQFWNYFRSVS